MLLLSLDSTTMAMRPIIGLYLSWPLVAQAAPLAQHDALEVRDNANAPIMTGDPPRDKTIFVVVAMFCTITLAFLLGMRLRRITIWTRY